ncbi:hypothetical protein EMPG_14374 [Blastomyces silverae]|uniref:Uncharacterized protein n=1 Tax=Blastomyces silverae TaxID=2060906 RepID=A0A0H1BM70_9EURO|nr:hypothetical protein EMPG_14374 [Blastomyces silverae]
MIPIWLSQNELRFRYRISLGSPLIAIRHRLRFEQPSWFQKHSQKLQIDEI